MKVKSGTPMAKNPPHGSGSLLTGELIPELLVGRPGYWVYRVLPNGTLLETELTHEEWQKLDAERASRRLARIKKLNQHPLNQAARRRLEAEGKRPDPTDLYLWDLLYFALGKKESVENDERAMRLAKYAVDGTSVQGAALEILAGGLDENEVECASLEDLAEFADDTLRSAEELPISD